MRAIYMIFGAIDGTLWFLAGLWVNYIDPIFEEEYPEWWKDGGGPPYIGA